MKQAVESLKTKGKYAGFIKRLIAFSIDIVIVILISTFLGTILMFIVSEFKSNMDESDAIFYISSLTNLFVFIAYFAHGDSSKYKGTVGKILMKISIIDENGKEIRKGKALLRAVTKLISVFALLGYITIPFSKKRKALHDYIMQTVVINN